MWAMECGRVCSRLKWNLGVENDDCVNKSKQRLIWFIGAGIDGGSRHSKEEWISLTWCVNPSRELFTNGIQIEVKEGIQVRVEKKDSLSSSWVATSIECSFVLSLVSRNLSFAVAVVELACLWIQSKTNFSLPFAQARSSLLVCWD